MVNRARVGVGVFLVAAVIGVVVFGVMAWRSVSVLEIDTSGAMHNFEEARMRVPSPTPLVQRDASGTFVRRPSVQTPGPAPTELHALAYHVDGQRLVRADVPLWFFKVKGPGAPLCRAGHESRPRRPEPNGHRPEKRRGECRSRRDSIKWRQAPGMDRLGSN